MKKISRLSIFGLHSEFSGSKKPPPRTKRRFKTGFPEPVNARYPDGAIAQLGERLHGMQEVSGSIPLSSTKIFLIINRPNR